MSPVSTVLLDALGTLVELQAPAPRLTARLAEAGFDVSEERAAAGIPTRSRTSATAAPR